MSDTLKEKTAKGLFWGGFSSGAQQLIGLLAGIVLGRILSPSDYGMIAMITIFSVIATELQNSGFKVALSNLPSPTHQDYNSVFWFNILVSFCLYILLFFTAPLIAEYYHTPDLVPLCRYAFLGCIFSSFGMAQSAYLFKNLRTKQQAKSIITAMVISNGVGITMALIGVHLLVVSYPIQPIHPLLYPDVLVLFRLAPIPALELHSRPPDVPVQL